MDLDGSGPVDRVTLSLTYVSLLVLEVQVLQVEWGPSVLLLCPLEDRLIPVCPPGEGGRVETPRSSAGQDQT